MVIPGNDSLRAGSRFHRGAGAQELTLIVCRLRSNARTPSTASFASFKSSLAYSTAFHPVSFNAMWFLLRRNRGTPKTSSRCCIVLVIVGCEMCRFSAAFDRVPQSAKAESCSSSKRSNIFSHLLTIHFQETGFLYFYCTFSVPGCKLINENRETP